MTDLAFVGVEQDYHRGDARPLADWVRKHELTQEQREFVAKALLGGAEQVDGRKHNRTTHELRDLYAMIKRQNDCYARMLKDVPDAEQLIMSDADIFRMLDAHFGFAEGTARRTVARSKKVKKELGHEKK